MDDKLMCLHNDNKQNYPLLKLKLIEPKEPKVFKPTYERGC